MFSSILGFVRNLTRWVTIYEVTRHYGGPEEGGWWYNWWEPVASFPVPLLPQRLALRMYKRLIPKYAERAWGDIYSVNDGMEIYVYTEWTRGENRSEPEVAIYM